MTLRRLRVLVAEDEALSRERLVRLVGAREDLDLMCATGNGSDALRALEHGGIDIALLDVEMPGANGVELLRRIQSLPPPRPLAIFITAHPRFAVDAFAGEAVDYVLKPFGRERIDKALDIARKRLESRDALAITQCIRSLVGAAAAPAIAVHDGTREASSEAIAGSLLVRQQGRLSIVRDQHIDWIEADGRYCLLHCGVKQHRINGPLTALAARLQSGLFVQVSRSALINIERIHELHEMCKGDLTAIMKGGAEVAVSRRFRAQVLRRLGANPK